MKIKTQSLLYFVLLFSCSTNGRENINPDRSLMNNLPKKLIEITYFNNEWVIFEPCDAMIGQINFIDKDSVDILILDHGQEAVQHIIDKVTQEKNGDIKILAHADYDSTLVSSFIFHKSNSKNFSTVTLDSKYKNMTATYILAQDTSTYKTYLQPCKECFPEEECEENENKLKQSTDKRNDKNDLSALQMFKGKYPNEVDLFEKKILKQKLKMLLGNDFSFFISLWETQFPIEADEEIFFVDAMKAHLGGDPAAAIYVDFKTNIIYVGIRNKGKVKIYSEDNSSTPQLLKIWQEDQ